MATKSLDRILVLCSKEDKKNIAEKLSDYSKVDVLPAIEFEDNVSAISTAVGLIDAAMYIIFGSKHSVRLIKNHVGAKKMAEMLSNGGKLVFAAGKSTKAELELLGITVEYSPELGGLSKVYKHIAGMERGPVLEISSSTSDSAGMSQLVGFMYVRIKAYSAKTCLENIDVGKYSSVIFQSSIELRAFEEASGIKGKEDHSLTAFCMGKKTLTAARSLFSNAKLCKKNDVIEAVREAMGVIDIPEGV